MSKYSAALIEQAKKNPRDLPPRKLAEMIIDKDLEEVNESVLNSLNDREKQQIRNIIFELKKKYGEEDAWAACSTLNDYVQFIQFYPESSHKDEADRRIAELRIREIEEDWQKTCRTNTKDAYCGFIDLYPGSKYEGEAKQQLDQILQQEKLEKRKAEIEEHQRKEKCAWEACSTCQDFIRFKENYPTSFHVGECEEKAWSACLASNKKEAYRLFIDEFPDSRYRMEADEKLMNVLDPEAMEEWLRLENNPRTNISEMVNFYKSHRSFKKKIHDYFIENMAYNPNRYVREAMVSVLTSDIFEPLELVKRGIITLHAKNWIEQHPKEPDDDHQTNIPVDTTPTSPVKNTDVYFFGVPGSGKSTVLAGLFKLESECMKKMSFKLLTNTTGYNYAKDLTQYIKEGLFPRPTQVDIKRENKDKIKEGEVENNQTQKDEADKYIQIMNTELLETVKGTDYIHHITFIEMPGERTLQFAAGGAGAGLSSLGPGTENLFRNGNRKVLFFILDPDPNKGQFVKVNEADVFITQGETLNFIVELISKNPEFLESVDAMHVILTKSDIFKCFCPEANEGASPDDLIEMIMNQEGYAAFKRELMRICSPKHSSINEHCGHCPYVFTFSLGKVMPGHVVDYRRASSENILNVIRANTRSIKENSAFDSFREFMNRIPFKR